MCTVQTDLTGFLVKTCQGNQISLGRWWKMKILIRYCVRSGMEGRVPAKLTK